MRETIGDRIKSVREKHNLSTTAFAKNLEISQPSLTGLENNKSEPRAKTIIALIEKFGVDPMWLLTGRTAHVIQNQTSLRIGQLADMLSDESQNIILKIVKREALLERILKDEKIDIPNSMLADYGS